MVIVIEYGFLLVEVVYDYNCSVLWLLCVCSLLVSFLKWCGLWKKVVRLVVNVLVNVCYLLLLWVLSWLR